MPKVLPGLIQHVGAQEDVYTLLEEGVTDPAEIADRLNQNPHYLSLAKTFGATGRQSIMRKDVELFLKDGGGGLIKGDLDSERAAIRESKRAQEYLSTISDRINGLIHQAEAWEYVAKNTLRDVETMQRDWRDGTREDYPVKEISALSRTMETHLKLIQNIKGDDKVQSLARAGTYNVNQGFTQEQVFEQIFSVCEVLGHDRQSVMKAFAEAMSKKAPIDVTPEEKE